MPLRIVVPEAVAGLTFGWVQLVNGYARQGWRIRGFEGARAPPEMRISPDEKGKGTIEFAGIVYNIKDYDILRYNSKSSPCAAIVTVNRDRGHSPRHAPCPVRYCVIRFCL